MVSPQLTKLAKFLVAVNDLTIVYIGIKVASLSGAENNQFFDAFLEYYNMIEIEIMGVYKALFDLPLDSYSFVGYIASKIKTKEMCEAIIQEEETYFKKY